MATLASVSTSAQSTYSVDLHSKLLNVASPRIPGYDMATNGTVYMQVAVVAPDALYKEKTPFIIANQHSLITIKDLSSYGGDKCCGAVAYASKNSNGEWVNRGFAGTSFATYQFGFCSSVTITYYNYGASPTITAPVKYASTTKSSTDASGLAISSVTYNFEMPTNTFNLEILPVDKVIKSGTVYNKYVSRANAFGTALDTFVKSYKSETQTYDFHLTNARFFVIKSISFTEYSPAEEAQQQEEKKDQLSELIAKTKELEDNVFDLNRDGHVNIADVTEEINAVLHPQDANGHEGVNLGLPSRTIWATMNVGATSPEDAGIYFSWAETSGKSSYNEEDYKYKVTNGIGFTNYWNDKSTELALSDDAANKNWGGSWRMPSKADLEELTKECKWELINDGAKYVYKVTGPNGRYIYLPGAGAKAYNMGGWFDNTPMYWSRSLTDDYEPCFLSGRVVMYNYSDLSGAEVIGTTTCRCYGMPVRAVMGR